MASPLLEIKPKPIGLSTPLTGPDKAVTDLSGDSPAHLEIGSTDVLEATEARFRGRTSASCA